MFIINNINRYYLSILEFKERNIIILNNKNIKITRLNKSLNYKNLKLFEIIRVINNMIYELELS